VEGVIYKATNKINDKVYIGQTIRSLKRRIKEHKNDALNNRSKSPFHAAIRKYGLPNFEWKILDEAKQGRKLDRLECEFIQEYKARDKKKGYNLAKGGGVLRGKDNPFYGKKHAAEVKRRIGLKNKGRTGYHNKGKHLDEETKRKIRKTFEKRGTVKGKNNPMYGRKHSTETKIKLRELKLGRKVPEKYLKHLIKKWLIIYPDGDRKVIKNLSKFCKENNLNQGNMSMVASGKINHCKGYKCKRLYNFVIKNGKNVE